MSGLSTRLSYANVVSTCALVLAVAGGGVAVAAALPANSVGSKQITNGSIKGKDLKAGAVTGGAVADGRCPATTFSTARSPAGISQTAP